MNAQKPLDDTTPSNGLDRPRGGEVGRLSPDYAAWHGLNESPQYLFTELALALLRRPFSDVTVVLAQVGLTVLACAVVKYGGGGMPPLLLVICVLALALMIGAPAFCHLYASSIRSLMHAENSDGEKDPPESGVE